MKLEVCVDSVESAVAAQEGGADRVELCADLDHGGTTPSAGLIKSVRSSVTMPIHVMIRPRAGDFCYSDAEFEVMKHDVEETRKLGADSLVFGILTHNGRIDVARTEQLVALARPLPVTFHRAFDESTDLFQSLSDVRRAGVSRVLTSGGKLSVGEGIALLNELVRAAGSSVTLIAGGGIDLTNVAHVVRRTGVKEVHVLSSVSRVLENSSSADKLFSSPRRIVDAARVRQMVGLLRDLASQA